MSTPATVGATLPVLRAMLDQARRKNYRAGVLGVRARPQWDGPREFQHDDVLVRVAACPSALAVREALLDADPDSWLVVLTDRDDEDLGAGLLGHLVWQRIRNPDPWEAVVARFAASAVSAELVTRTRHRELAVGLLAAQPPAGWPPAPGGVLTADHALTAVARRHLRLPDIDVDAPIVLGWTATPGLGDAVAELRSLGGDAVTDAALEWLADRTGHAAGPVSALLTSGQLNDALPLGLVAGLVHDAACRSEPLAQHARIRLEPRLGGRICTDDELAAWGRNATAALEELDDHDLLDRVVARADALLGDLQATPLAAGSDVLRSGLTERIRVLAASVRTAVAATDDDVIPNSAVQPVEASWARVEAHRLAVLDRRAGRFASAVRLVRWLATPDHNCRGDLERMVGRHRDEDGWVDAAVNDVAAGVGEAELGEVLGVVLSAVQQRRGRHDRQFAAALAAHTAGTTVSPNVLHLEDVLPDIVLPLATQTPVLLVVVDGMSMAVATEVLRSATAPSPQGWLEAVLPGQERRTAALALLPTLTWHSRCSLLSGRRASGGPDAELRGFDQARKDHPSIGARLFHKKPLESTRLGMAVADDVGAALDDVTGCALVACVLNTVDDALDRSDPGGTDWTVEAVKHLEPLLERAARSGRTVVLTSDHGHVIERRRGTQRPVPDLSSARSRGTAGPPAGADEVLVHGDRVLTPDGVAVLAVDEQLRYGPLKAGYHGGASPAEVVVPVCILVPGAEPEGTGLRVVAAYEPVWWNPTTPATLAPPPPDPGPAVEARRDRRQPAGQTELFASPATEPALERDGLVDRVLAAPAFAANARLAGRALAPDRIHALLTALRAAPGNRLTPAVAAARLDVPVARLRGALAQAQRLLNVEGYPVLRSDVDGMIVLDEPLLREQFGV